VNHGDLARVDADQGHEIVPGLPRVGDDERRPFHEFHRDAKQLQRDAWDLGAADASRGQRQQDDVVAGDDRPARIELTEQVALAVVDDVDEIGVQIAHQARIHSETAGVGVELRPHE
jgi:hypothetical protein